MPLEVHSENFEQEVVQADKPVLVDFWGPQCRPCLALMPHIENLGKIYGEQVKITKVDASKNRRLCIRLRVMSLPTFLFYKNGEEVSRRSGEVKVSDIENILNGMLKNPGGKE